MKTSFLSLFAEENVASVVQSCLTARLLNQTPNENFCPWVQEIFITTLEDVINAKYPRIRQENIETLSKFAEENATITSLRQQYGILPPPLENVEYIEEPQGPPLAQEEEKVNLSGEADGDTAG